MTTALVIGGGISGLACAQRLTRAGVEVRVVEAESRAGGVIGTALIDGFRFERGPNTVQASARSFRALCDDLGIADQLVTSRSEAKRRYLFHEGELRALPSGPGSLLTSPLLSFGGKLRLLSEPVRGRGARDGDEPTFEAFLERRIGREATRTLAGSFVRGVYAAEIGELGAASAFPRLWDLVHDHGGLVRGMIAMRKARRGSDKLPGPATSPSDLLSFEGGLGELPAALARELGDRLLLDSAVQDIERGAGGWSVSLEDGRDLSADVIVLAVPARAAHRMLAMAAPERLGLDALLGIGHASLCVVHLGLESTQLPPGFGFLVPPDEAARTPDAPSVLGTLFTSNLFDDRAPAGCASITSMYRSADVDDGDDAKLVERARADLVRAIGADSVGSVRVSHVDRWNEVIPRYGVGHRGRMDELESSLDRALPGLWLCGSYVGGVSVDDCIARGRTVADGIVAGQGKHDAHGGAA
ncbi:MAG: protoporphyrinogen oxidase [bacterium]|nr:protoporphyrinogen oxidase [bacterium]